MKIFRGDNGACYHLAVREGEVMPRIVAVGAPERARQIAKRLDRVRLITENRGHLCFTGNYKGAPLTVFNTGMGSASASIVLQEALASVSAEHPVIKLLRLGTAGSLQARVKVGALVVSTGSVRDEGTTDKIIGKEYPSIADLEAVFSLKAAIHGLGLRERQDFWVGVTHCKDELYFTENPNYSPVGSSRVEAIRSYERMGVLATEMEFSVFTILADLLNQRYASSGVNRRISTACLLLVVSPYAEGDKDVSFLHPEEDMLIDAGLEALIT